MVASKEVELPYYKGVERQRGRGFGALAQVIGRTAIPFLKKYVVPAARSIGADMLGFAVPEIADVVSGKQNFKAAAKNVERQTLKINSVVEVGNAPRAKSFSLNPRSGTVGHAQIYSLTLRLEKDFTE